MDRTGSWRAWRLAGLLLGANLLVLGLGLGSAYVARVHVPALPELNADKIRLWSQPQAYRAAGADLTAVVPAPPPAAGMCIEIVGLDATRFRELGALLTAAGLGARDCTYVFDKRLPWWVYWPPEYEAVARQAAERAMRASGLRDILPITQGSMAQAYSLGVFALEEQASQYRDRLRSKGLAKVEYGPRPTVGSGRLTCEQTPADVRERMQAGMPEWLRALAPEQCAVAEGESAPSAR